MRIGIISDTHRFTKAIDEAIPYLQDCDLIVHAGDNIDDARLYRAVTDIPVVAVKGIVTFIQIQEKTKKLLWQRIKEFLFAMDTIME